MVKDGHLGGFVEGGDSRCHYPLLWDALIKDFKVKSVLDVGCGQGQALEYFSLRGVKGLGIDGTELVLKNAVFDNIEIHDYVTGPYIPEKKYDLVWCCEFVEHIEEKYLNNFLETFKSGKVVALTHALPGQGGYHHVNEKNDSYWIEKMKGIGFKLVENNTYYRQKAHEYFLRSGLVFVK